MFLVVPLKPGFDRVHIHFSFSGLWGQTLHPHPDSSLSSALLSKWLQKLKMATSFEPNRPCSSHAVIYLDHVIT